MQDAIFERIRKLTPKNTSMIITDEGRIEELQQLMDHVKNSVEQFCHGTIFQKIRNV